jgi:hypothetical protein
MPGGAIKYKNAVTALRGGKEEAGYMLGFLEVEFQKRGLGRVTWYLLALLKHAKPRAYCCIQLIIFRLGGHLGISQHVKPGARPS